MTEEEIEKRISICEERRRDYLEAGNTKIADKYSNEIYKWERLLSKLDPKKDEQLKDYKKGYERLQQGVYRAIQNMENIKTQIDRNKRLNRIDKLILFTAFNSIISDLRGGNNVKDKGMS